MFTVHGKPRGRRVTMQVDDQVRYDGRNHWPGNIELNAAGKPKQRNCKLCYEVTMKESKTTIILSDSV